MKNLGIATSGKGWPMPIPAAILIMGLAVYGAYTLSKSYNHYM